RGLLNVDVRVNERANWMAPPYRSPAQQNAVKDARAYRADDGFSRMELRNTADELRAAGADEATVRRAVRGKKRRQVRFREAVADGTAAFTYGGTFWCTWGFKP
ncbi:MAG: hypothetical protein ACYTGG_10915, partial [Planctomycetota bacterium]